MMRLAYNLALILGLIAASPVLAARLARGKYRTIGAARLGLGGSWLPRPGREGAIWLHALSVGEVGSALPLLDALGRRFPDSPLVLSTATAQGLAVARTSLQDRPRVELFLRPLDVPWAVRRLLNRLQPRLFCLVEGDIWPNWQWALAARGIPRLLVNMRVSPRTFKGYRRMGPLARRFMGGFDVILAQTRVDYDRLLAVGVGDARLSVGGNLKFDSAPPRLDEKERLALAVDLGLQGRTVLTAGSTHPGEEEPCLDAFQSLCARHPGLALVLAPREVKRGAQLARLARERGLRAARASQGKAGPDDQVLILDVLGRLARVYALARAAFVGGSLVPVGGHNLLEPAAQGVPAAFGPHTHNFQEMALSLEEAEGGARLVAGGELARVWGRWLDDPDEAGRVGAAGLAFCRDHRGAVSRAVREAAALLGEAEA